MKTSGFCCLHLLTLTVNYRQQTFVLPLGMQDLSLLQIVGLILQDEQQTLQDYIGLRGTVSSVLLDF